MLTPVAAALSAILVLAVDPAGLDLNFPTTDFAEDSGCLATVVRVEPKGRLLVAQVPIGARQPGPHRKRHWAATDLGGLPAALTALKPNRCEAVVEAAVNAPWEAVEPVYAALRQAGYRDFMTVDPSNLEIDPGWD